MRPDEVAARVAAAQDGATSAAQLAAAGLSRAAVATRVERGWLRRVHRGAYLLGPVAGPWAAEWAALLACGADAAVGDRSALARYGLAERPEAVHLVVRHTGATHAGVVRHRVERLDPRDAGHVDGMPITAPARTLLDVASSVPAVELARLVEEAMLRRLVTRDELWEALERGKARAGAPALRGVLARDEEPALTRSEAERRCSG